MENLSLNEPLGGSSPQRQASQPNTVFPGPTPQGPPQLPPQMFTTAAQLLDLTDKKLLLVLRDGRKIFGVLRSWDQFANLVLTDTRERYFVSVPPSNTSTPAPTDKPRNLYCDIPRGTYLVRGENVLLLGEVDLDKDDDPPPGYEEGDVEEVFRIHKAVEAERKKREKGRGKKVGMALDLEGTGEILF